ncbi:MAG: Endolytic murein transglycosylase [Pseudonocardiales bacterium]|nr:Endolytic murein transglycosylase [Pseudonocardiales bacterium]
MVHGERESLTEDPHTLLFGHDDLEHGDPDQLRVPRSLARADHRHRRRVRRSRGAFAVMASFVIVVIVVIGYVSYRAYVNRYHPKDYAGAGSGSVMITVKSGDGATDIGKTLDGAGVVASSRAFTNAAQHDSRSQGISPGTYKLHKNMSAKDALTLMLDPTSRMSNGVVVFEGATVMDVASPLAKAVGVDVATAKAAIKDVSELNLPSGYSRGGSPPSSVEGFLYPATYTFDAGTKPVDALTEMITKFIDEDRSNGFAARAKAVHLTPYDALIIASIAEKEAKVAADYPKVARVILNRIAKSMPLQIDATSAYAAKLLNLDPTKVIYAKINSPYNTYTHAGLPPTPISSPGSEALTAAIKPAAGDWLYYVNGDKKGDLYFTNNQTDFATAVQKCRENNWGCG